MAGRTRLRWILAALVTAGCGDASLAEPEGLGLEAAAYLELALDIMEFNSIRRHEIEWSQFREAAITDAGDAKTRADTYPAIHAALARIGDGHSFFREPGQAQSASPALASPGAVDPMTQLIEPEIGYVDVPAFSGGGSEADQLATLYHEIIEDVDTTGVCGWVVDLRGNTGGNMWPMIAGVGPILGEGQLGFFLDPDSLVNEWFYADGAALLDAGTITAADPYYDPGAPPPPVAVLTDGETASSGEAVTIAFRGRPDTRSFGEGTFGLSTANVGFGMPDGAVIFLTVSWMGDRTGQVYGEELVPDSIVTGSKTGDRTTDAPLEAALSWLETTHCN